MKKAIVRIVDFIDVAISFGRQRLALNRIGETVLVCLSPAAAQVDPVITLEMVIARRSAMLGRKTMTADEHGNSWSSPSGVRG